MRSSSGFTLIEILIAVTIGGIIMAMGFRMVTNYLRRSNIKTTRIMLNTVQSDITAYRTDIGAYPNALEDLVERPSDPSVARKWDGPYIDKFPKDSFGNELVYSLSPKGSKPPYELYSWGPNGEGSPEEEWIKGE